MYNTINLIIHKRKMNNQHKILVHDRDYVKYEYYNACTLSKQDLSLHEPYIHKLFSNDVFKLDNEKNVSLVHSSTRSMPIIPGILILNNNKTYGNYKNKKLYRCIPDDKRLPIFLIPYAQKSLGFNKNIENKFIIFKFYSWDFKHPYGQIVNTLGDVSKLDLFYEYQLYCKSLYASIQEFTKETTRVLKINTQEKIIKNIISNNNYEDRTDYKIFTIDSRATTDFDDAVSIKKLNDEEYMLSIYISNVPLWINELQLWNSFSQRISSIYLPDRKRPMLPTILSECLCSLVQKETRFAFTLDLKIKDDIILDHSFKNTIIKIYKNHVYESDELLNDNNYKDILMVTKNISKKYKYLNNVKNSFDLITYLMILTNYYSALSMIKYKNGIYRSSKISSETIIPDHIPEDVEKFLKIWNSSSSSYSLYDGKDNHDMLELESYIHITSPIRRLVDLLNIYQIQVNLEIIGVNYENKEFYKNWVDKLEYINTTMRSIRKVQNDCSLLTMCMKNKSVTIKSYEGYMFDKLSRDDDLFQYMVYIPELNTLSRITCNHDQKNYSKHQFKIFLFNEEDTLKKKVRLELLI